MTPLRVAVVDDERLARERIRRRLAAEPDFDLVLTCATGDKAVSGIVAERPDVVFLDVQMPGRDGLAVAAALLEQLPAHELPLIVFVTAHDEHAVSAFEAEAVDYLVKPFEDERFSATLERVRRRAAQRRLATAADHLRALLDETRTRPFAEDGATPEAVTGPLDRIVLRRGARVVLARADAVDWVEAESVYARLHIGPSMHLIRMAMHEMEARLDAERFVRIHRSTIVNLDRVRELREVHRGEFEVLLHDGSRHPLSRNRKAHLEARLGQSL